VRDIPARRLLLKWKRRARVKGGKGALYTNSHRRRKTSYDHKEKDGVFSGAGNTIGKKKERGAKRTC